MLDISLAQVIEAFLQPDPRSRCATTCVLDTNEIQIRTWCERNTPATSCELSLSMAPIDRTAYATCLKWKVMSGQPVIRYDLAFDDPTILSMHYPWTWSRRLFAMNSNTCAGRDRCSRSACRSRPRIRSELYLVLAFLASISCVALIKTIVYCERLWREQGPITFRTLLERTKVQTKSSFSPQLFTEGKSFSCISRSLVVNRQAKTSNHVVRSFWSGRVRSCPCRSHIDDPRLLPDKPRDLSRSYSNRQR